MKSVMGHLEHLTTLISMNDLLGTLGTNYYIPMKVLGETWNTLPHFNEIPVGGTCNTLPHSKERPVGDT